MLLTLFQFLKKEDTPVFNFPHKDNGDLDFDQCLNVVGNVSGRKIIQWTFVNNETGIVRPLSEAEQLKNIEGVEIICDAVQSPGKTEHWRDLS